MITAAGGIAVPILVAAPTGHPQFGFGAALGGLLAGNGGIGRSLADQVQDLASVLWAATAAAITAVLISGHGIGTDLTMIILAAVAAGVGGYSRYLAVATARFIIFLLIVLGVADTLTEPAELLLPIGVGALWTAGLSLLIGVIARAAGWAVPAATEPTIAATAAQKLRRWKATLLQPSGWEFVLRLTSCLGIASILKDIWPEHHLHWIALTVAILCQRRRESVPVKAIQRGVGAILGVAATGLLVGARLSGWTAALLIAVLAGFRSWLLPRNYLAYTAGTTPLIILLLDGGRTVTAEILLDRLGATAIGAVLVVAANMLIGPLHSNIRSE